MSGPRHTRASLISCARRDGDGASRRPCAAVDTTAGEQCDARDAFLFVLLTAFLTRLTRPSAEPGGANALGLRERPRHYLITGGCLQAVPRTAVVRFCNAHDREGQIVRLYICTFQVNSRQHLRRLR
eukprot:COSAG06_NODE_1411_length_9546_cov_8.730602_14_plen_127_part_00